MKSKNDEKKVVLVACTGMSPAVLTETVWALAHQKPSVVPDEVEVITTSVGKQNLQRDVVESGVWRRMCDALRQTGIDVDGKLVFGSTSIQVIPDRRRDEMADLRTADDNRRAADFMVERLRKYTEEPETVVLASIAGGRKTMGALLLSCMSLLGRDDDKAYHVLLPPEFEVRLDPPFYFPEKGVLHAKSDFKTGKVVKKYKSIDCKIELFEVPFVRLRSLCPERLKTNQITYSSFVEKLQSAIESELEVDVQKGTVRVDDKAEGVGVGGIEFATLLLLLHGVYDDGEIYKRLYRSKKVKEELEASRVPWDDWRWKVVESTRLALEYSEDPKQARHVVADAKNRLRTALANAGIRGIDKLVPKRSQAVTFPMSHVKVVNDDDGLCAKLSAPLGT